MLRFGPTLSRGCFSRVALSGYMRNATTKAPRGHFVKTKVVATLGPATSQRSVLQQLVDAGVDVVRLNFSHGTHETQSKIFKTAREVSSTNGESLAILVDIQGPKIRVGEVDGHIQLNPGQKIKVTGEPVVGTEERITITHESIVKDLQEGDEIFINDGTVKLRIEGKDDVDLHCVVESGGLVSSRKGCNIPSSNVSVDLPTPKDKEDLKYIAQLKPEYVAASFIGCAADVDKIRECLAGYGFPDAKIVSKIERPVAISHIDDIIQASDGVMVARGDLGVEIPAHEVPAVQKNIVRKCNRAGIPVIVATQMLESMLSCPRPTRAEASDVFNSVYDGADAVMLSGETSVGSYPVQAVEIMNAIVHAANKTTPARDPDMYDSESPLLTEVLGHSCYTLVQEMAAANRPCKIVVASDDTMAARMIAKYRPNADILFLTSNESLARQLDLVWGVDSVYSKQVVDGAHTEARAVSAIKAAVARGRMEAYHYAIVVSPSMLTPGGQIIGVYPVADVLGSSML